MSFVDVVYRCPICGADAMQEHGSRGARCGECERVFEHIPEDDGVQVREGDGTLRQLDLVSVIARVGDPERHDDGADGEAGGSSEDLIEAAVLARFAREEDPVWYRRDLLGFVERRGAPRSGTLRLTGHRLEFVEATGRSHSWRLLDLRAVQTASASLQISPLGGGVVTFRVVDDSPRRWEDLLRTRLREAWRSAERGEIVEFQPRIRTR